MRVSAVGEAWGSRGYSRHFGVRTRYMAVIIGGLLCGIAGASWS